MSGLLDDLDYLYNCAPDRHETSRATHAHKRLKSHIEATTPWLPPQQEGFGPWIEYREGDPGPRVFDKVLVLSQGWREEKYTPSTAHLAHCLSWEKRGGGRIVAYCVKLPEGDQ